MNRSVNKSAVLLASLVVIAAIFGCSQSGNDSGQQPVSQSDTAVHDAETAAGAVDEVMARGEAVFNANCAACHQVTGQGLPGAFPPLAGSDFLQGNRREVMQAALFGLSGPITVNGNDYNGVMPSMGFLTDQQLADTLTYVFNAWGIV